MGLNLGSSGFCRPEDPRIQPHAGIKMAQVLGSLVYIFAFPLIDIDWHTRDGGHVSMGGLTGASVAVLAVCLISYILHHGI